MKRRSFFTMLSAAMAALAIPRITAAEEMEAVQYGQCLDFGPNTAPVMPAAVRSLLDVTADNMGLELGLSAAAATSTRREYLWLPADRDRDPLNGTARGVVKFFVEEPRSKHDARVKAEIAAGGWIPYQARGLRAGPHQAGELADFRLNGKVARYERLVAL